MKNDSCNRPGAKNTKISWHVESPGEAKPLHAPALQIAWSVLASVHHEFEKEIPWDPTLAMVPGPSETHAWITNVKSLERNFR